MLRDYLEEVFSGVITTIFAAMIITRAQALGPISPETIVFSAIILFIGYLAVKLVMRYCYFRFFSGHWQACGLFIEIFPSKHKGRRVAVLAPTVVYFRILQDTLAIRGQAFRRRTSELGSGEFEAYAKWNSLVMHVTTHSDDYGAFYLHDGRRLDEKPDDIPGVTSCELPKRSSAYRARKGYFCDLQKGQSAGDAGSVFEPRVNATQFELFRAEAFYKECLILQNSWRPREIWRRILWKLRIAPPSEEDLNQLANSCGMRLIFADLECGSLIKEVRAVVGAQL